MQRSAWVESVQDILDLPEEMEAISGGDLRDEHIVALRRFPRLQELWIHGECEDPQWGGFRCNVSDAGMRDIAELRNLRRLTICCGGRSRITLSNDGLAYLKLLPELESLELGRSNDITDVGLVHVADCAGLKHLVFSGWYKITDEGLACLSRLKNLESLAFDAYHNIFGEGLKYIAEMTSLKTLSVFGLQSNAPRALRHIQNMTWLKGLSLGAANFGDAEMKLIGKLVNLEFLNTCFNKSVSDEGLQEIKTLKKLKTLDLNQCKRITNQGLKYVAELSCLESLTLTETASVSDEGVGGLRRLTNLRKLTCRGTAITGRTLSLLPSIEKLDIYSNENLNHQGVQELTKLKRLKCLNLSACQKVEDLDLGLIGRIDSLESLSLEWCSGISDRGVQKLTGLKNLSFLSLSYTNVSAEGLVSVVTLPSLKCLHLFGCKKLTRSGAEMLRELNPELAIHRG